MWGAGRTSLPGRGHSARARSEPPLVDPQVAVNPSSLPDRTIVQAHVIQRDVRASAPATEHPQNVPAFAAIDRSVIHQPGERGRLARDNYCAAGHSATASPLTLPPSSDQRSASKLSWPNAALRRTAMSTGFAGVGGGSLDPSLRARPSQTSGTPSRRGERDRSQLRSTDRATALQQVDLRGARAHADTTALAAEIA